MTIMKDDVISRQAAIDAAISVDMENNSGILSEKRARVIESHINTVPPAQQEQQNARIFQGIVVEYPSNNTYPEYKGKPYFSIKYTENGQEFIGYGTYKPEVLSEYLKEYFCPNCGADMRGEKE